MKLLLERVEQDRFPSNNLMDRLESSLQSGDDAARYVEILFDKVAETRYPSLSLLDRMERVLAQLPTTR